MTIQSTTHIEAGDIKSIEFECSACHSKMSVPMQTFSSPPTSCMACENAGQWLIPGSEDYRDIVNIGHILRRLAKASKNNFVLHLEITDASASREASDRV